MMSCLDILVDNQSEPQAKPLMSFQRLEGHLEAAPNRHVYISITPELSTFICCSHDPCPDVHVCSLKKESPPGHGACIWEEEEMEGITVKCRADTGVRTETENDNMRFSSF